MQAVDDKMETIHLYVVREEEKRPYTAFPLFCAFLCLVAIVAVTFYSAQHPYYQHERLTVPATLLPLKVFTAAAPIIPTGVKDYIATRGSGVLTIYSGSSFIQYLPAGAQFVGRDGAAIVTDNSVTVPPGNPPNYGVAIVSAHALLGGKQGNITAYDVNSIDGSSIFIRNLSAFIGGRDAYSVNFITEQDKQTAFSHAQSMLFVQR